jgi:hypothetical protein
MLSFLISKSHILLSGRIYCLLQDFYLGTIRRFSWDDTTVSYCRFHSYRRMNTIADIPKYKISPFPCLNVEFCFSRCKGTWAVTFTFQYRLWARSIKQSLQQFQYCRVGLSLGILVFLILYFILLRIVIQFT